MCLCIIQVFLFLFGMDGTDTLALLSQQMVIWRQPELNVLMVCAQCNAVVLTIHYKGCTSTPRIFILMYEPNPFSHQALVKVFKLEAEAEFPTIGGEMNMLDMCFSPCRT